MDRQSPRTRHARHRHDHGYVALVLSGHYEEAGDTGRHRATPGSVLVQRPFHAHADVIGGAGAVILCLPLPADAAALDAGRIDDVDEIVRLCDQDLTEAVAVLFAKLQAARSDAFDWPDALAGSLRKNPDLELGCWAETHGVAPSTVSRGFSRAFGVPPNVYRADQRVLSALRGLNENDAPLAALAAEHGFADQAHMTREVKRVTGFTPGAWRRVK